MSIELGKGLPWPECLRKAISTLGYDRVSELIREIGYEGRNTRYWLERGTKPAGINRKRIRDLFGWTFDDLPPSDAEYAQMPGYSHPIGHGDSCKFPGHKKRLAKVPQRIERELARGTK